MVDPLIWLAKMRGVRVLSQGSELPGSSLVRTLDFYNCDLAFDAASSVMTITAAGGGGGGGSIAFKQPVRVATTANITLTGTQTIDAVALSASDRVLVKNQTTASQNGIYVVSAGAWTRAPDMDADGDVVSGMLVPIQEGSVGADHVAMLTTNAPITLGTTALVFALDRVVALSSSPPADVTKSAASAGSSADGARADHKHDISTAAPTGGVSAGGSAAEGTATSVARSDHAHPVAVAAPVDVGTANSAGSASTFVRSDHVHNVPASVVVSALSSAGSTVSVNNQRISNVATPTGGNDATNKTYVDSIAAGVDPKASVIALADSNVSSLSGLAQTIDGVAINAGNMRVLLTAQTTGSQNGIWVSASGAWTRPSDFTTGSDAAGAHTFIERGTNYHDQGWVCTSDSPSAVVDTNSLVWTQFTGTGTITAGAGLTKTGNTIDFVAGDGSLSVAADSVTVGVISDAQHGNRGGGALHAVATGSVAGFMSASDKTKLDGLTGVELLGKQPVRAATTASITLSAAQTIDGVTLVAGDRVLVKDQATGSQNGIYVVASGAWTRATDADSAGEVFGGMIVPVSEGTLNGNRVAMLTTNDPITIGTTALTFAMDRLPPITATAPADVTKAAASAGTSTEAARADHKHDISTAAPTGGVSAGGSAAEGTATSVARSDHAHPVPTALPVNIGTANAAGSSSSFVRADHVHALTFAIVSAVLATASTAISVNGQNISSVATPVASSDAATKGYVDGVTVGYTAPSAGNNGEFAYVASGVLAYTPGVKTDGTNFVSIAGSSSPSAAGTLRLPKQAFANVLGNSGLVDITVFRVGQFTVDQLGFGDSTNTAGLLFATKTGTTYDLTFAGALQYQISASAFDFKGNRAQFGTTGTGGLLNFAQSANIAFGTNNAGSQVVPLVRWGSPSPVSLVDGLYLGSTSGDLGKVANMRFGIHTGGAFQWEINGAGVATLDAAALALAARNLTFTTGFVSFTTSNAGSTTPAGAGLMRTSGSPGVVIGARNYDNTGDVTAFGYTGDGATFNDLYVGEGSAKGFNSLYLRTKTQAIVELATVQKYKFFTTFADFTDTQIRFGTTPATTAHVNAPNATTIVAAKKTTAGDMALLATNASNEMLLGDATNVVNAYQQFAGSFFLKQGTTTFARLDPGVGLLLFNGVTTFYPITCSTISFGSSVSSGGTLKGGQTFSAYGRSSTGTDIEIFRLGVVTDAIVIGGGTSVQAGLQLETSTGSVSSRIANNTEFEVFATFVDVKTNNLKIDNTAGVPAAPASGGYLYAQGGALWWVGSAGHRTAVAPA